MGRKLKVMGEVLVGAGRAGYNCAPSTVCNEVFVRKDKQKVVGEPITDEQVAVFLQSRPFDANDPVEQHMLTKAYRGLRAEDFQRFLAMFCAEGHDINATDAQGRTFLSLVRDHAQAEDYILALEAAGAR